MLCWFVAAHFGWFSFPGINPGEIPMPTPAKKKKDALPRFPKKELNTWLRGRPSWNHDDWLALLELLRAQGHTHFTDNAEGQNEIGLYLETHRK